MTLTPEQQQAEDLRAIFAQKHIDLEREYDLERDGLIVNDGGPYPTITAKGYGVMADDDARSAGPAAIYS